MDFEENKSIISTPLDFLVGDRFGKYAKYIIQERALPDVRDGLKPVQRRIIYAMLVNGNIPSKPYRKSATAAGFVMGHYHPHGDSSIYEAMVRMSQSWKQNAPLIDMQGNNGSIDDDPPAAMRYTEAKLSTISMELLKDIDKDTVEFAPNYDDSTTEPTVLPCKFPNLLVNGSEGIAAGYSTSIPPHNLNEVCNATIYRIKNPKCSLEEIMQIIPGPDFPTGGIIRGKQGLTECLNSGGGSCQVCCKYEVVEGRNQNSLVITEIPFGVVKKQLVFSIDKIRADKEIDGIIEVRDESGRNGLRIVIDIRKEANLKAVISYLMKKTKLVVNYNYNVIAICDKKPIKLGILSIIDFYIKHQVEVINRRTKFDLDKALARHHILEGMVKAISNIDELISIVRTSHSKEEIKTRLCSRFDIDMDQAEAIVTIQLHRLNSVDVQDLINETIELGKKEEEYRSIIDNEKKIKKIICNELEDINKRYIAPRKSLIEDEVKEYVVENRPTIKEDVMVAITRDGYFKRSSIKSYESSEIEYPTIKSGDIIFGIGKFNTGNTILCFTNKGNFIQASVYQLFENKWKEEGKHISSIISNLKGDEKIIKIFDIQKYDENATIVCATKYNLIKRININEFKLDKCNRAFGYVKLKDNNDEVIGVDICDGDSFICLVSNNGKAIQYHESQVPVIGLRSSGVKAMKLDDNSSIMGLVAINKEQKCNIAVFTKQGGIKVLNPYTIQLFNRTNKPYELYKYFRTEPHDTLTMIKVDNDAKYYSLIDNSISGLEFDNHHSPAGKNIRNTLINGTGTMQAVSTTKIQTIDDKFKTYKVSQKDIEITVEKEIENTKTIFDYLNDINEDDK